MNKAASSIDNGGIYTATNNAEPTAAGDTATKQYVDNGLKWPTDFGSSGIYSPADLGFVFALDGALTPSLVLPNAASMVGKGCVVADYAGTAAANNITLTVASGGTINGAASVGITSNRQARNLRCVDTGTYILH